MSYIFQVYLHLSRFLPVYPSVSIGSTPPTSAYFCFTKGIPLWVYTLLFDLTQVSLAFGHYCFFTYSFFLLLKLQAPLSNVPLSVHLPPPTSPPLESNRVCNGLNAPYCWQNRPFVHTPWMCWLRDIQWAHFWVHPGVWEGW